MGDRKAKKAASGIPEKQSVRTKQPPTQEKVHDLTSFKCIFARDTVWFHAEVLISLISILNARFPDT